MPEPQTAELLEEQQVETFSEIGRTGLTRFGGHIKEEFLPELQGKKGQKIYREMAENDAVVSAILFAVEQLVRGAEWSVEAHGEEDADILAADFLEQCITDMSHSWESFISEIMSMLIYGWSYFEVCWKVRAGKEAQPTAEEPNPATSHYDDGLIGIRKLAIRSQDSLIGWAFDEAGGIRGMTQLAPPNYTPTLIPISKALLFRTQEAKGNPEGRSILRGAYRSWYFKCNIEEIERIGIERDLAGLPVMHVPKEILTNTALSSLRTELESIIRNIRRDEQEGVLLPWDKDFPDAYKLELLSTGGRRQFDTSEIIGRYDARIAGVVLADFVLIGHSAVGSFALATEKRHIFEKAVLGWMDSIKGVINTHLVSRLFELNFASFSGLTALPELVYTMPHVPTLEEVVGVVSKMADAGATIFPNLALTNFILGYAGLPELESDEYDEMLAAGDFTKPADPSQAEPEEEEPEPADVDLT